MRVLSKDRFLQYTSKGIHRDDLNFIIENNKIKNFGSQGQQKSFLIALKLAQFDYYKTKFGNSPLYYLMIFLINLTKNESDK